MKINTMYATNKCFKVVKFTKNKFTDCKPNLFKAYATSEKYLQFPNCFKLGIKKMNQTLG